MALGDETWYTDLPRSAIVLRDGESVSLSGDLAGVALFEVRI